jgi:hypothetical protein
MCKPSAFSRKLGDAVNSIWGSGSLSRNLAVTLSAISGQGQTSAGTNTLVKVDSHGVGGYDPVAIVMEGERVRRKFPQTVAAEAFIERRTNDENNWTIGYCSDDACAFGMLDLFLFYVDMCIHVKKTSTKCHQFV